MIIIKLELKKNTNIMASNWNARSRSVEPKKKDQSYE